MFCDDRVRYLGDAVGLVVATTPEAARRAVEAITVRHEPIAVVGTMADAVAEGAPRCTSSAT